MYKYYLFKIKDDYNGDYLYNFFDSIRRSSIRNIYTSFSFYNSVTDRLKYKEIDDIINFISSNDNYQCSDDLHKYFNYFNNEVSYVKICNNYIYIKTNKRDSDILKYLSNYDNYYLCDFNSCYGSTLRQYSL